MASFLIAALEDDFCSRFDEIVMACGRFPIEAPQLYSDWSAVASFASEDGHVICAYTGVWTVFSGDYALIASLFSNHDLCKQLAMKYGTRVVTAYGDDTNCAYGYTLHSATSSRAVFVQGKVEENSGNAIPGEPEVELETYNEESVLEVLTLLGIDIEKGLETSINTASLRFRDRPSDP